MKKKKFNKIVFLLDETGSMDSIKTDTIGGFNTFLEKQQKHDKEMKFTLTLFNSSKIEKRYKNEPIKNVEKLNEKNYQPGYLTPLYDAIGKTITKLKNKKNVLFIILTDGEENDSKEYNKESITKLIKEKEEKYNWKFLFLGVGIDGFAEASKMGLEQGYSANSLKASQVFHELADATIKYQKKGKLEFDDAGLK